MVSRTTPAQWGNGPLLSSIAPWLPEPTAEQLCGDCTALQRKARGRFLKSSLAWRCFPSPRRIGATRPRGQSARSVSRKFFAQERRNLWSTESCRQMQPWCPRWETHNAPGSPVAGRANVLIFPDLDSGNIGYSWSSALAGALALGVLSCRVWTDPAGDLSRGRSAEDIANVVAITALRACKALEREEYGWRALEAATIEKPVRIGVRDEAEFPSKQRPGGRPAQVVGPGAFSASWQPRWFCWPIPAPAHQISSQQTGSRGNCGDTFRWPRRVVRNARFHPSWLPLAEEMSRASCTCLPFYRSAPSKWVFC